jgi:release factor glutamine methyltransferase
LSVGEAIAGSGIDAREARLLLAAASGFSQATVAAFPEKDLPEESGRRFAEFVSRRKQREPVAYIVGHKEFYGLDLLVTPAVLIPRPETELLVELALQREFSRALDLGTGSGAIALALKKNRPAAKLAAVEASAAALVVARRNAVRLALEVDFRHGRWFEPVGGERFDLVLANPPYVAAGDPHLAALCHEPETALVSGPQGLDAITEIAAHAAAHMEPGGWLLLEHGMGQDASVRELLLRAGLESVRTWADLAGIPRVTGGRQ